MQQMREAFPLDQAPRFVLRDRDAIYGRVFAAMTRDMGMEEVLTAPRSPWQVSGPRDRGEREIDATNSAQLFCLLSTVPNALSLGHRRPGAPGSGTAGTGARGCDSTGRGITPPIRALRCLAGASPLHRCLPC